LVSHVKRIAENEGVCEKKVQRRGSGPKGQEVKVLRRVSGPKGQEVTES
jgi:hypothetical protein